MSATRISQPRARGEAPGEAPASPPDPSLLDFRDLPQYVRRREIPWQRASDGTVLFAAEDPHAKTRLSDFLQAKFRNELAREATEALRRDRPIASASRVATISQIVALFIGLAALIGAFVVAPKTALI